MLRENVLDSLKNDEYLEGKITNVPTKNCWYAETLAYPLGVAETALQKTGYMDHWVS